jgi:thiol-disulfide isomerase/thioredoxin
MKSITILKLVLLSSLFITPFSSSFCQTSGIKIGEMCPDVKLSNIVNYQTDHASIADFRGKILILDFWATWCAPCISMIPRTDSLQKEFAGQLQILPVTAQDKATVSAFMKNMSDNKKVSMTSVVNDKILAELFPHVVIPHYVWLDKSGKVIAITGAEQLKAEVIKDFLNKKGIALPVKKDNFKTTKDGMPLFIAANELTGKNGSSIQKINDADLLYHSVITKFIDGFGCEQRIGPGFITCKNSSVGDLYRMAASHYNLMYLNSNSTIWETSNDIVRRMNDSSASAHSGTDEAIADWMKKNTYCYELQFPKEMGDEKYDLMLRDLNNYFGAVYHITGGMEHRKTKSLVLSRTGAGKLSPPSTGKNRYVIDQYHLQIKNGSIKELISLLSINLDAYPPLIDETHLNGQFDIDLKCRVSDLNALNIALKPFGLQLVEKVVERDMIVIKNKAK